VRKEREIFEQEKSIIMKDLKLRKEKIRELEHKLNDSECERTRLETDMNIEEK